jgi:hypothetical protein
MNFLKFNQKTNLEIDKRMNSAWAKFSPRLGTAGPAQRPKWPSRGAAARRWAATRRWRHEHEGSQAKPPGKVRMIGSHRASGVTTRRQGRVARRGFFNGDGTPVNLSSRPQVLQLWEGEEEMWGKIKHMEEPQRWHSQERGGCGGVRLQNRWGGGSSTTKLAQEDKGPRRRCCVSFGEVKLGAQKKGASAVTDPF